MRTQQGTPCLAHVQLAQLDPVGLIYAWHQLNWPMGPLPLGYPREPLEVVFIFIFDFSNPACQTVQRPSLGPWQMIINTLASLLIGLLFVVYLCFAFCTLLAFVLMISKTSKSNVPLGPPGTSWVRRRLSMSLVLLQVIILEFSN